MIYTLDLFLNYKGNIDDIANEISKLFGIELTKENDEFGEKYSFYFMEIEFILYGSHELEDERNIIFSDYKYQIQINKLRSGMECETYDVMYEKAAMFLMEKLSRAFNVNAMLVDNLQILVSKINAGYAPLITGTGKR